MIGLSLSLSLGSFRPGSSAPPVITNPSITGSYAAGETLTGSDGTGPAITARTWDTRVVPANTVTTGVATASTYTVATASDEVRYGVERAGTWYYSDWLAATVADSGAIYSTDFTGPDGTYLAGWTDQGVTWGSTWAANPCLRLLNNDLAHYQLNTEVTYIDAGVSDQRACFIYYPNAGDSSAQSSRNVYARWTDLNNSVYLLFGANAFTLYTRVGGTQTQLTTRAGLTIGDFAVVELRVQGNYATVWLNGARIDTVGGSGADISAVPLGTKVGVGANTSQQAYPANFLRGFEVYSLALNASVAVNAQSSGAPGQYQLDITAACSIPSTTGVRYRIETAAGVVVQDWQNTTYSSGAGTATFTIPDFAYASQQLRVRVDSVGGAHQVASVLSAAIPVDVPIPATQLGINYGFVEGYKGADVAKNLLETPGSVRGTNYEYYSSQIYPIDSTARAAELPMDQSGAITDYPTVGGVKRTALRFTLGSQRAGTYTITPPPGMTASPSTITVPSGGTPIGDESLITDLSGPIPTGGIKVGGASANFTCLLNGDPTTPSAPPNALHDGYDMGTVVRWMSAMRTNNSRPRTLTVGDELFDGPASQGGRSLRAICEYHNAIYTQTGKIVSPWINIPHDSNTSFMVAVAQYLKDHLNPALTVRVEYSNETWNRIFDVWTWLFKQGYNAGYCSTAPTVQTVADAQLQAGTIYPAITYTVGQKVFAHVTGLCYVGVFVAKGTVPIGSTGALPTTAAGNTNWSVEVMENQAVLQYAAREYKAYKERQMIDAFTGVFTGADRSRLILHHADGAFQVTNAQIVENITFFDNHLDWDERSITGYWGQYFGTTDLYTYGATNTGTPLTPTVQALYTAFDPASPNPTDQETFKAAWFSAGQTAADEFIAYQAAQKKAVASLLFASPYNVPVDKIPHSIYEGNLTMTFPGYTANVAAANAMQAAIQADSRMGDLITYAMTQWEAKVGGLFCWFALNSYPWIIRLVSGVDTQESTALMAFQAGL